MNACADCALCAEQPPIWDHKTPDGVFIKQMLLKDAGTLVPQHAHVYAHTTMLARGKLRVWREAILLGDFEAPCSIFIEARVKHSLLSLEPDTVAYCIHNVSRTGDVEVYAEHQVSVESLKRATNSLA